MAVQITRTRANARSVSAVVLVRSRKHSNVWKMLHNMLCCKSSAAGCIVYSYHELVLRERVVLLEQALHARLLRVQLGARRGRRLLARARPARRARALRVQRRPAKSAITITPHLTHEHFHMSGSITS